MGEASAGLCARRRVGREGEEEEGDKGGWREEEQEGRGEEEGGEREDEGW